MSFALAYPNFYGVGMSNLGLHVIYRLLNGRSDTVCERVFLPENGRGRQNAPGSVESGRPLGQFDIVGFAVSFEMDYWHILEMLTQSKINIWRERRTGYDPFLIAGGPCATFNPEPLADFFDAFVIGEGEAIMPAFMDTFGTAKQNRADRGELLAELADVPGIYVPSLYAHGYDAAGALTSITPVGAAPTKVRRQWVADLDAHPAHTEVVTDDAHFDMYLIETARGCGRHCRFCMAGYAFRPPRIRQVTALAKQIAAAAPYGKRLGLMGAAISDHPQIDEICRLSDSVGLKMSVASFRADSVTATLVQALAKSGQQTLTLAPEAGSDKMRRIINKGIEERHLFHTVELGLAAGIKNFRLYLMIGLPYETETDIAAIIDLTVRLHKYMRECGGGKLTLSINPFVPKPVTPFQWLPMATKEYLHRELKTIRRELRHLPQTEIIAETPKAAYIQGILARGDRRLGKVLALSHERGGQGEFLAALTELGLNGDDYACRKRDTDEIFPWDTLDLGVKREYLLAELRQAEREAATVPCFDGCRRCGVCTP